MKNTKAKSAAFFGMVFLAGVAVMGCKETTKETETVVPAPAGDTAAAAPDTSKTTESSTTTTNSTSPSGDSSTTTEKSTTEKKP